MDEKTTVTIKTANGFTKELAGDTAIVFMVSNVIPHIKKEVKNVDAECAFVGKKIPECIFANIMGSLTGSMIETHIKDPVEALAILHECSEILNEIGMKILNKLSPEQLRTSLEKSIDELISAINEDEQEAE